MKLRSPAPPCGLLLALAAVLLPTGAQAQSNRGGLFSSVGLTSDYRYQGVSNSDGNPALQGYVHWWRPDGFYAGLFATQVDFDDPGDTSYELDLYGGKNFDLKDGKTRLTAEAMFTAFPNEHVWGPTYNFIQFKAAARQVLETLDHRLLNEQPPFVRVNPSAENIAAYIFREMKDSIAPPCTLHAVTVYETPEMAATYREGEDESC